MAVVQDLPVAWPSDADDEAFDAMYRQHKVALLAFCGSRLRDAGDAEDACQEAFLRAYRAGHRYDRSQRPWPWLATIAANVCTDMRRRKRPVPLGAYGDGVGGTVDPDHDAEARENVRLVSAAIRDLPEPYRRPVHLADVEGWSYEDIAAHERKSVSSVRSSLMRGRAAFKVRVQALAEERGMWPLSAAVPLSWLRRGNQWPTWRAGRDHGLLAAASPGAFPAVQAAAAAIALLSTMVPNGVAAVNVERDAPAVVGSSLRADRPHAGGPDAPAANDSRRDSEQRSVHPPLPTTRIELAGDRRSVDGAVIVDDEDEPVAWQAIEFDCDYSEVRRQVCDGVDSVAHLLP